MNRPHFLSRLITGTLALLFLATVAKADPSDLLFTVKIDGDENTPTFTVTNNSPTLDISRFDFTIGDTSKNFDYSYTGAIKHPPGGAAVLLPLPPLSGTRADSFTVLLSNFGPGESFSITMDVDADSSHTLENFKTVFFNNNSAPNSIATVHAGDAASAFRTLPDGSETFVFRGPSRILTIRSQTETLTESVQAITVRHDNRIVAENVTEATIDAAHGDRIQISVPNEIYRDIHAEYFRDSNNKIYPGLDRIDNDAQERFTAIGMSVNNVAETGDPTRYDFEILRNTDILVKWAQAYALTVKHDFTRTQSIEVIAGTPWAGPLESDAAGNPSPTVSKHWIPSGSQPVVQIDGQLIDISSHPGLDLRYVVEGFRSYGPPNTIVSSTKFNDRKNPLNIDVNVQKEGIISNFDTQNALPTPQKNTTLVTTAAAHDLRPGDSIQITGSEYKPYNGTYPVTITSPTSFSIPIPPAATIPVAKGMWKNVTYIRDYEFPTIEQRQQIAPFTMNAPGGITYFWKIQYGVRVSTDDVNRINLAKVIQVNADNTTIERTVQDGVSWFDPGTRVRVVAASQEPIANGLSLTSWMNGDGYHFSSLGEIDPSTKLPTAGQPAIANGSPVASWGQWTPTPGGTTYIGYEIPNLQRPARVLWRYGSGAIVLNVTIGKHLFQDYPAYASMFVRKPEPISNAAPDPVATPPGGVAPSGELMAEWDPVNNRLYPTIPGTFTVPWKPGTEGNNTIDVRVISTLPFDATRGISGHYPHIHGTPAVALDPDPEDSIAFKSIKHTTAGASVDATGKFVTERPGISILLFSNIQSTGRGQPREFLNVRVVHTRPWDANLLPTPTNVTVGTKITDPADRAILGTGYLLDLKGRARYNPFIYNPDKLKGLAAKDLYDMDLLRSDNPSLKLLNKSLLPGPIIPVNAHPGVPDRDLPIVVWYDSPAINEGLLWPYLARIYNPQWPSESSTPRIVIASQLGSEGKGPTNLDQVVAPAIAPYPVATTFDPSRLQAVQIYSQPNPNAPGYNPNEEHALVAPSLRFADVSPRPPAIYALRDGDLNYRDLSITSGPNAYTSSPFVLVQFQDLADGETKMKIYSIKRQTGVNETPAYKFANDFTPNTSTLSRQPFVLMRAGEPVNPFYPLGVAIGASPAPETFGNNLFKQEAYWEDWRGSYWSISGGNQAWFETSFYYPLNPDFWWPANVPTPSVTVTKSGATYTASIGTAPARIPNTGDSVAFLPSNVKGTNTIENHLPTKVLYKSDWPENPPILKAGETLTFSGGEFRGDNPTTNLVSNGVTRTVDTPGLPQLTAFASAEVVFDSLNPEAKPENLASKWTARVIQALDKRTVPLAVGSFPSELQPASGRTSVSQGKYIFNELPASLQRRLRYDPLSVRTVTVGGVTSQVPGVLEIIGLLNDKNIGDATLTAAPPAVYVLEPNILTADERDAIIALIPASSSNSASWTAAVNQLYLTSRNPESVPGAFAAYLTGLMKTPRYNSDGSIMKTQLGDIVYASPVTPSPMRAFGPGLALVTNGDFLDPLGKIDAATNFPDQSWITVVENNDPSLGGSPITPHIIKVDRNNRYRGSIKTILSDNVFDENIILRSTGDFGANADELVFEWYYRPDDGSLNVPPPDLIPSGQTNPWKLYPDPTGKSGLGRFQITLKGNPNAPEALLADTFWFVRYRHKNDNASGTNWKLTQQNGKNGVNFVWAGAGNSQPFVDLDLDGFKDFRAQLAQGWIKRVLDAVNPYEARIRDFEGDNPSTLVSMIGQFGQRYEGPVALNPAKNVIENVGLIELYETILDRGRKLSIDLSQPVSTPAIANALQLASTRISDFYTLLGNEAYADAINPSIGHGSDSVDYGNLSSSVHAFQNQMSSVLEEELALLRGVDDFFARPVYNRLFWNFTKGEGEAAYATNYGITDINADGFIDEDDAMLAFPQGHGDAWGHYLTAIRNQYDLLKHPFFNWVSRSESYNLQDIVITVDFLDERKFAATAAAKAKAGAEIVNLTYRDKYVADSEAQWHGYTDSNPDRAWGVDETARRAAQGAYFDWVTANALLPSVHPNGNLEGIRKVDRESNADIAVISANLNAIQSTLDQSDKGYNPLGLVRGAQVFDLDPYPFDWGSGSQGDLQFDQILARTRAAMENTAKVWDQVNESGNMIRQIGTSEAEFRNSTFEEDLSYRNRLIEIFGKPYEGTVGPGKAYPAGYEGPDLSLYMYVPVRQINKDTVPGPATSYAAFTDKGTLDSGDLLTAYSNALLTTSYPAPQDSRDLFAGTFASATNSLSYASNTTSGMFAVNYTDLTNPKVNLTNFVNNMPITAAGYTFQAPPGWGARKATGELQDIINQMIQQEAEIAQAIGAWDALSGESVRILRLIDARLTASGRNQGRDEVFTRVKYSVNNAIKIIETTAQVIKAAREVTWELKEAIVEGVPVTLPTGGLAISPGDALSLARAGIEFTAVGTRAGLLTAENVINIGKLIAEIALDIAENELNLTKADEDRKLQIKEWLKEIEDKIGDEPVLRIAIFKEMQSLRSLSDKYKTLLDQGGRLVDERAAFNKRVAAQTQLNRYQDMTFRVSRNHALQNYRNSFNLSARYAYLAASAYDYETNFANTDPASPEDIMTDIVKVRSLAELDKLVDKLEANYYAEKSRLGLNNIDREFNNISLRSSFYKILPSGEDQPDGDSTTDQFPSPGQDSDSVWQQELQKARVPDLWQIPEFREYCRPFASSVNATGKPVPQPGIVIRFASDITSGRNFFGKPLAGGDIAFSTSNFATKIGAVGISFSGYNSDSILNGLSGSPRVYFLPTGMDIMRVSRSDDPDEIRTWKVVDQAIPTPYPATASQLAQSGYIPLIDSLNGRFGTQRRFSDLRAYAASEDGDPITNTRLFGRSIWNTEWLLIIPGATLHADPEVGLDRFVEQVGDILFNFETYSQSGG
jgi:hypothetical protein